jgi:hypothetical protein
MKIFICGSMSFAKRMLETKERLEGIGHLVSLSPDTVDCVNNPELNMDMRHCLETNVQEKCFKDIAESDAILVLNYEKDGINGYIGGATLMEIGLAQHLGKKIYLLNPPAEIKEQRYALEVHLARPVILNGDLRLIN